MLSGHNTKRRRGVLHRKPVFRKLLVDAKQQKDPMELTLERLPEILMTDRESRRRRSPTVTGEGYKISSKSVSDECAEQLQKRVVPRENRSLSSLSYISMNVGERKAFFIL